MAQTASGSQGVMPVGSAKILLVDDTPANLVAMSRILDRVDARIFPATSAMEALNLCLEHDFALALIDVYMPDMDGYALARTLFSVEQTRKLPILFVTSAARDEFTRLKGYELGAVDYIEKPVDDRILLSKVNVFLELFRRRVEQEHLVRLLSERQEELNRMVAERTRELGKATRELDTLNACNEALLWFKDEPLLLREISHILVTVGGFLRVWVGLDPDPEQHTLTLAARIPDLPTADPLPTPLVLPPRHEVWKVLSKGEALFGLPDEDPVELMGCTRSIVPLASTHGCMGILVLYSPEGHAWGEARQKPMVNLANNLAHGLEALRETTCRLATQEALRKSEERLRELAIHMEEVREKERRWIAQEVHDEMGNSLANLKMRLLWLKEKMDGNCPTFHHHFPDLISDLDETLNRSRQITQSLRPTILDHCGLLAALQWLGEETGKSSALQMEFQWPEAEPPLDDGRKTALFRIAQEALTNITRHANANKVKLCLQSTGNELILVVEDDGRGLAGNPFDQTTGSMGLSGMQERARQWGGMMKLQSRPGHGLKLTVALPWSPEPEVDEHTP